jgi:thioredoxin 1
MTARAKEPINRLCLLSAAISLALPGCGTGAPRDIGKTMEHAYPGLATISLGQAVLAKLPSGVLLRSGKLVIKSRELDSEIAKAPAEVKAQLKKNRLFILEQMATGKLLAEAAGKEAAERGLDVAGQDDNALIRGLFDRLAAGLAVSDSEAAAFHKENSDAVGGATLAQVKDQIKQYLMQQKTQELASGYVRRLGERIPIEVSASWIKTQATLARDNEVDKARSSGLPSMVDFGSAGCRPCDMMAPILEEIKKEYQGRANIIFIHVNQEQVLAARFGIQSIPVQVFFDKTGKEVSRHVGFYPKDEIIKQLKNSGVE